MRFLRTSFLLVLVLVSLFLIFFQGLQLGIDFRGGTLFQLHFSQKLSSSEMENARAIVEQRVDWTGLKDTTVRPWGDEFIIVEIAESDPENISKIEELLKRQGTFEAMIDGNVLFTGLELRVSKDPGEGYGVRSNNLWVLPFTLKTEAAKRFAKGVFHKCVGLECDYTYFYIDREVNSTLLVPAEMMEETVLVDRAYVPFTELMLNTGTMALSLEQNAEEEGYYKLTEETKQALLKNKKTTKKIIYPNKLDVSSKLFLKKLSLPLREVTLDESYLQTATNLRAVIALTPGIANMEAPTTHSPNFKIFTNLTIQGGGNTFEEAKERLSSIVILLESGSLPTPIDDISKEVISPSLGKFFLKNIFYIGILALVVVSLVLFIRYRKFYLIFPILFTGVFEILLILGVASLIGWNLDFSSLAGILAVVGTGVDDQIIISDELLRREEKEKIAVNFLQRIRNAFFVIFAAAATLSATMLPIVFSSFAVGRLVGFAITTLFGVAIGVFITRPAFAEVARYLVSKFEKSQD